MYDASIWPDMEAQQATNCAALFIDIRGSSRMSATAHDAEASTVAVRTRQFLKTTRDLWASYPQPSTVRSVGDGLFIVWNLADVADVAGLKEEIFKGVLMLNDALPKALEKDWGTSVRLGFGLAGGDAAKASLGKVDDYYGYVINLAAKLQDLARPYGAVILGDFVNPSVWQPAGQPVASRPPHEPSDPGLSLRTYDLPMARNGRVECLVTPDVNELHDWTCLAWPGFAISRDGDGRRLGLNTRGVTVLTHQGLKGNIGTLRIWPRNDARSDGDRFELIIDDFDSLAEVSHTDPGGTVRNSVCGWAV